MRSQLASRKPEPVQQNPGCIYVLAAVTVSGAQPAASPTEPVLRRALGKGDGELLLIAKDAEKLNQALAQLQTQPEPTVHDVPTTTPREIDVLCLVARGLRTSEIAEVLHVSLNTVNTHLKHLYRKLGVGTRSEAVFEATRLNIIQPYQ